MHRIDPRGRSRLGNGLGREWCRPRREDRAEAGRIGPYDGREQRRDLAECLLVEARASAARIDELPVNNVRQLQGAEMTSAPLGRREPHDNEISGAVRLQLQPLVAATSAVRGIGLLRDDALEAERIHLLEKALAFAYDVVERANNAELREGVEQQRLALYKGQWAKVVCLIAYEIERIERGRQLHRGMPDLDSRRQTSTPLQQREARPALRVEHHHLAINDEVVEWKCLQRAGHLRKDSGVVVAIPCEQ